MDERKELMLDILFLLERLSVKSLKKAKGLVEWLYYGNR